MMKWYLWMGFLLVLLPGMGKALADDTDIFGVSSAAIQPNVLIIFDTSGSMDTEDVPLAPYDGNVIYTNGAGYEKDALYRWANSDDGGRWTLVAQLDDMDPTCLENTAVSEELRTNGQTWIRIGNDTPHRCGTEHQEVDVRTGNFLNYESGGHGGPMRRRMNVAKDVVKQLIADYPGFRFGLMRFSPGQVRGKTTSGGGRITDHGDISASAGIAQLHQDIDGFTAGGESPLAEVLAEAGLYFAGQQSWYNDITYTSPIDIKCRPSIIILMTDGDATQSRDQRLSQPNAYINGGTIGDCDGDGNEGSAAGPAGDDYLDDVAMFLHHNDLMPQLGTGDLRYENQNIQIHTIGFKKRDQLLQEAAENGGGEYIFAGSSDALSRAFEKILRPMESGLQIFSGPSVPVSRSNGAYSGDFLYLGLFDAGKENGPWVGNLKKYKLDPFGRLVDQNGLPATDEAGLITNSARSFWSTGTDGAQVALGGAGEGLLNEAPRRLYTFTGSDEDLTAEANAFSIANTLNISTAVMGVANEDQRQMVINDIHGVGKDWVMGDVLHWKPRVVRYDTNGDKIVDHKDDALIFVGTNGGVLHAFLDSSGRELWGFIPPQQLGRLKLLSDPGGGHPYFIDGHCEVIRSIANGQERRLLVFGERRGGHHYYALDVTHHDRPGWAYSIGHDILGENAERLGQSWGRPQHITISSAEPGRSQGVLLLPGGYDTNQDAQVPEETDGMGRAVFSVVVDSGQPGPFQFYNDGGGSDLTHCIVDVVGVDPDGDGITNSIYAPDLGGRMFAFSDADNEGHWQKRRLFDASSETHRKIFFSPDVVTIIGDPDPMDNLESEVAGEMVFFGTGDVAHPGKTTIVNRFYAVKNFERTTGTDTLTDRLSPGGEGDLHDATDNPVVQGETLEAQQTASAQAKMRMGWFVDLEGNGEKVVGSPVVFNRTVYFTTYVPPAPIADQTDADCGGDSAFGEARLYGLDYLDARAVHDDWSAVKEYDPVTRKEIASGGKADRYKVIGLSMPSAPVIAIRNGIAMLYVGVGEKVCQISSRPMVEMREYYWREF